MLKNCRKCGSQFNTKNHKRQYCLECSPFGSRDIRRFEWIDRNCLSCGKTIVQREGEQYRYARIRKFCNRSCAAAYNNTSHISQKRRRGFVTCKGCNKSFLKNGRKFCDTCFNENKSKLSYKTKGEVIIQDIRTHARSVISGLEKVCKNCGYERFVEVCHIRPVSSFSKTALLLEINDPNNLMYLCRNCHWEFDHGILSLSEIEKENNSVAYVFAPLL